MSSEPTTRDASLPSEPARLCESGSEEERRLLQAAALDAPAGLSKQRALTLSLAALRRPRERRAAPALGYVVLGLLAATVFWLATRAPQKDVVLGPEVHGGVELQAASRSVSASALSAGVVISTRGVQESAASVAPSGSSLAPCPGVVRAQSDASLIDDFEDGNARLLISDGREGAWVATGEGKAKQVPAPGSAAFPELMRGARGKSRYGLHFRGERFETQGASLRAEFAPRRCYDASRYGGIEFWARGSTRVYVGLMMIDMMARQWGGLCDQDCFDPHMAAVDLTPSWQRYELRWEQLAQMGYGAPLDFDPRRLLSLELQARAPDTPFDVWLDDVQFLKR
jgi:hypothetical protein